MSCVVMGGPIARRPLLESRPMHIHILGICGTFMGGLAALAREAGHKVTGCDAGVYPPCSAFEAWFVSTALDDGAFDRIADALPAAARAAAQAEEGKS